MTSQPFSWSTRAFVSGAVARVAKTSDGASSNCAFGEYSMRITRGVSTVKRACPLTTGASVACSGTVTAHANTANAARRNIFMRSLPYQGRPNLA